MGLQPVLSRRSRINAGRAATRDKLPCYSEFSGRGAAAKTAREFPRFRDARWEGSVAEIGAADRPASGWGPGLNLRHCHEEQSLWSAIRIVTVLSQYVLTFPIALAGCK